MGVLRAYAQMLPGLLAERELALVRAASAPSLKSESRRSYIRGLQRDVKRAQPRGRARAATVDDLAALGIGHQEG